MTPPRIARSQRYHLGDPPPAPAAAPPALFRWLRAVPGPLRLVLFICSPLLIWLAVCLLAVGGWLVVVGYLLAISIVRPRRRGRPSHRILRRNTSR